MGNKVRKNIVFHGCVQGVGFRYRSYYLATRYNLTGWVKNCYDDTVMMEVQGTKENINSLINTLKYSRFIHIDKMDIEDRELKKDSCFEIIY